MKELVFTIDEQVLPGSYEFLITLSDSLDSSHYSFTVYIIDNKLPFFTEELEFPVYKIGTGINNYSLPGTIDEDGDTV